MTNKEAYKIIAKHVFIASLRYSEDFAPILILADNMIDAREKARTHFGIDVNVWMPTETEETDIYKV